MNSTHSHSKALHPQLQRPQSLRSKYDNGRKKLAADLDTRKTAFNDQKIFRRGELNPGLVGTDPESNRRLRATNPSH